MSQTSRTNRTFHRWRTRTVHRLNLQNVGSNLQTDPQVQSYSGALNWTLLWVSRKPARFLWNLKVLLSRNQFQNLWNPWSRRTIMKIQVICLSVINLTNLRPKDLISMLRDLVARSPVTTLQQHSLGNWALWIVMIMFFFMGWKGRGVKNEKNFRISLT